MTRALAVMLLLAPLVLAQGIEALVNEALDPTTDPIRRAEALRQILSVEGGDATLARRGLDLTRTTDAEVVHAVVSALVDAGKAVDHVEAICNLLLSEDEGLCDKVLRRLRVAGQRREDAAKLLEALRSIALGETAAAGTEPLLRRAGVRALAEIPERDAVTTIVDVWARDEDAGVQSECRRAVEDVLLHARTAQEARDYLQRNVHKSYLDLLSEVSRARRLEIEKLRSFQREAISAASATRTFLALEQADDDGRRIATARLRQLAQERTFGEMTPEKFATGTYQAYLRERDREERSRETLANLLQALAHLAAGAPAGETPLLFRAVPREELLQAVAPLAELPAGWEEVGKAAIGVLTLGGETAAVALSGFARNSKAIEVRRLAVQGLGDLARGSDQARDFVGLTLSELLQHEKAETVRRSILFSLRFAPREQATKPLRSFFFPEDPKTAPALAEEELKYCVEILRRLGSEAALNLLVEVAEKHPVAEVRLLAIREGLLARGGGPDEEKRVLDILRRLALDRGQPAAVRSGIVTAVGERAGRRGHALLVEVGSSEGIEEKEKAAVVQAKLRLGERLMSPAGGIAVAPEDLQTAAAVLQELHATADPVRLDKLAQAILVIEQERQIPAERVRFLRARICLRRPEATPEENLRLYEEAAARAADDRLGPADETALLLEYRRLLREGEPRAERLRAYVATSERLAALAGQEAPRAAAFLLDAAECAASELRDAALAGRLMGAVETLGVLEGALAERARSVREQVAALSPEAPPAPG